MELHVTPKTFRGFVTFYPRDFLEKSPWRSGEVRPEQGGGAGTPAWRNRRGEKGAEG